MIRAVVLMCCVYFFAFCLSAQNYGIYRTKKNDNLESISDKFGMSADMVRDLNPEINFDKLSEGKSLIIISGKPAGNSIDHILKKGETIFRLSKKYNVSIGDIKRNNNNLNIYELSIGQTIKVPVKTIKPRSSTSKSSKALGDFYIVKSGDTSWSISGKKGISLDTLMRLNPGIKEGIKVGDTIVLNSTIGVDKKYVSVRKSGGDHPKHNLQLKSFETGNVKSKAYGELDSITTERIRKIYTHTGTFSEDGNKTFHYFPKTFDSSKRLKVAIVLPLKLNKYRHISDTLAFREKLLKDNITNLAMDFYMGACIAIDSLRQMGADTDIEIFDSEGGEFVVAALITKGSFNDKDLVIGPFFSKPFNRLSQYLEYIDIPIVSPLSYKGIDIRSNTIISLPSESVLRDRIVDYVLEKEYETKKLLITKDYNRQKTAYLRGKFPDIIRIPMTENEMSIDLDALSDYLSFDKVDDFGIVEKEGLKNLVFLESSESATISSVTSVLNSCLSDICSISMVTTDKNKAFDSKDVSNHHLSNLEFHYASPNMPLTDFSTPYVKKFQHLFGVYPNRYANRGFDLVFDILARLLEEGNIMNTLNKYKTRHIENVFDYDSAKEGGFISRGVRILKYKDMMRQEIIKR